jgi:hypothetical protein
MFENTIFGGKKEDMEEKSNLEVFIERVTGKSPAQLANGRRAIIEAFSC